MILIGTGSEVQHLPDRAGAPGGRGHPDPGRLDALPGVVLQQDTAYQQEVLPRGVKARVTVEAGIRMSWDRILGDAGEAVSIEHYGASAPAKILFEQFGFTADNVVAKANAALAKVGEITGHKTGNCTAGAEAQ